MRLITLTLLLVTPSIIFADDFIELKGHEGPTRVARFTPDGKLLATSSGWPDGDKTIRIWDINTKKEIRKLTGHTKNIDCMTLTQDGKKIVSGSHDGTVRIWELESGKELLKFSGHKNKGLGAVAISPDGKTVASGDGATELFLWEAETGKKLHELKGHTKDVRCLEFTPDGKTLVSGSWDETLRVWDVKTGEFKKRIEPKEGQIWNFQLYDQGNKIAIACSQKIVTWDMKTNESILELDGHPGAEGISVSPDMKKMATSWSDGTMKVWDLATGKLLESFQAHDGFCFFTQFSPDSKTVATVGGGKWVNGNAVKGEDFAVRLWKLEGK